ncbi:MULTISPECIES: aminodeoxychorismate synthase component I [unclassified Halomonas]|uniref:aminodeoxychorismate synthase component I n=1 Tax=unclassified Halomonas TaxID=2609666 RepID=UPI001C98C42A|nr:MULTISPECIES: aminodeoxychorismate synthase component I [unclassified Halomonas]MBY5927412.1 aminodeoxychorismate synthase component I [Halomonas sp. DP4Y7-2]MBY6234453.1 aminodeoxychorismate synthase component I [Halomonas sp. DP4Y7-1]
MNAQLDITPMPYQPTPLGYFESLRSRPGAVLLDSGRPKAPGGRFDILTSDPLDQLEIDPLGKAWDAEGNLVTGSPFAAQQRLLNRLPKTDLVSELPFLGGLIGYWSYDLGRLIAGVKGPARASTRLPLARLGLYDWALIQDHEQQRSYLVADTARRQQVLAWLLEPAEDSHFTLTSRFTSNLDEASYRDRFERVQHYIRAGDCYQINLAQRYSARYQGDLWGAYRCLRAATPTPFSGFMSWQGRHAEQGLLSVSPERFIECREGTVEARPIKGTRPRGQSPAEDLALAEELRQSVKDQAENVMIVDLLRNDLGRVCETGSVNVPQLCGLESYANVHHLVSIVSGKLPPHTPPLTLMEAAFPGGSITGAPKIRAMQIIDELEPDRRSAYCGSLGYVDVRGHMDTSIAIRTVVADDKHLHIWGGGGLVADSEADAEYTETRDKIRHLMSALGDSSHQD